MEAMLNSSPLCTLISFSRHGREPASALTRNWPCRRQCVDISQPSVTEPWL